MPDPFADLSQALSRLPGFGRRSAERAALSLVGGGPAAITPLVEALVAARDGLASCRRCGAVMPRGNDLCRICSDPARDAGLVLVVDDPGDILAIERSGAFRGQYHALRGLAFPQTGTVPADTAIPALEARAASGTVREIVLALPTDVEGDANAAYIRERLRKAAPGVAVSRLAWGLPADSAVRYSDPLTLRRAIAGRQSAD